MWKKVTGTFRRKIKRGDSFDTELIDDYRI